MKEGIKYGENGRRRKNNEIYKIKKQKWKEKEKENSYKIK